MQSQYSSDNSVGAELTAPLMRHTERRRKQPTPSTIKALFAKSGNQCAFSDCTHPLVDELNILVGELCHISAVNEKDARFEVEMRHFMTLVGMIIIPFLRIHKFYR